MTDDLKHLKDAMNAATPQSADKDAHLALAMKNFDDLQNSRQGSADGARHTSDHPTITSRFTSGVIHMFHSLTTRGALAATTSIVAVGIGVMFYTQQGGVGFDLPKPQTVVTETPVNTPVLQDAEEVVVEAAPVVEPVVTARAQDKIDAKPSSPLADADLRKDRVAEELVQDGFNSSTMAEAELGAVAGIVAGDQAQQPLRRTAPSPLGEVVIRAPDRKSVV